MMWRPTTVFPVPVYRERSEQSLPLLPVAHTCLGQPCSPCLGAPPGGPWMTVNGFSRALLMALFWLGFSW